MQRNKKSWLGVVLMVALAASVSLAGLDDPDANRGDFAAGDDNAESDCGNDPNGNGEIDPCEDGGEINIDGTYGDACLFESFDVPGGDPIEGESPYVDAEQLVGCVTDEPSDLMFHYDGETGFQFWYPSGDPVGTFCMRESHEGIRALALQLMTPPDDDRVAKIGKIVEVPIGDGRIQIKLNGRLIDIQTSGMQPNGGPTINDLIVAEIRAQQFSVRDAADYFIVTRDQTDNGGINSVSLHSTDSGVLTTELALELYNFANATNCSAP